MSKYSVGLRNVGSYMVSGQPYITGSSVNAGDEVKIEFPFVTKNVTIRIPPAQNTALDNTLYLTTGQRYRTAPSDANGTTPGVYDFGAGNDFTLSIWLKLTDDSHDFVFDLTKTGGPMNRFKYIGTGGNSVWRLQSNLGIKADPGPGSSFDEWNHWVITQHTGSVHLYANGTRFDKDVGSLNAFDDIVIWPNVGSRESSIFDEITMWNVGMTHHEVSELWNYGDWFNPLQHSKKSNLSTWHTMGDAAKDLPNKISNDLAGTNESLNIFTPGNAGVFTSGPFLSQTVAKLRTHLASKSNADVYNNFHYKQLQGYGSSITLPMKTKELYLSAVDAQATFEVIAELTNIPTGSMYKLAGSGIDE